MKFSCEKALLQSAIAVTSRAVAQKSSIPALEGLLLHADSRLTISGYNLQTGIRTKVSADVTEPGEIVLNARLFGDIIRRMPDDVVVFTADDKQLVHLSCGDADFDILGLSAADYPELPMVEDDFSVSIQQKLLRAMIEETAFAVSTNESRPIHTGALFEITDQGLTMVAVDGFRLAIRREPLEKIDGGAFSFVAPGSALGEVKNICSDVEDLAAVTLGKSHILFEVGDTELICRRLEGEFLDYKNAIPRKNPISVIADTKALIESIDRVSVVISEKQKSPVRCLFDHDKVLLSAKTGNGEAKLICRRLEGEFLDYKNAIPRKNPISVIADTKALIESIDRVSVVISEKQKSPVRCLFDHDKVLLSAKTGNGEAKDICRLSGDGGGLEIGFNNRYLMEALRYAPADTVKIELNTGVSPAIIVPTEGEENFLYMVLPVRLKSAE